MKVIIGIQLFIFFLVFNHEYRVKQDVKANIKGFQMKAVDISFLPTVRSAGVSFKNKKGIYEDPLVSLKNAGVNTIRIRIWNNPDNVQTNIATMKKFSDEVKRHGLKVYLTLHYSDTWADPGHQIKPAKWNKLSQSVLKDSLYTFTKLIMQLFQPDFIQLGNEINNGFLWPNGRNIKATSFTDLMKVASKAVRETNKDTKIIIHYSGIEGASSFYPLFKDVDYDIIGLSYYPKWHGGDFEKLSNQMNKLSWQENKSVLIAETAYPFALENKDQSANIITKDDDILPEFQASPEGQAMFISRIKRLSEELPKGAGFCYWGGTWVSSNSTTSMWENQTLWDFNHQALPALLAFKELE